MFLIVKETVIQLLCYIETITNVNHCLRITSSTIIFICIICQMLLLNKRNHKKSNCSHQTLPTVMPSGDSLEYTSHSGVPNPCCSWCSRWVSLSIQLVHNAYVWPLFENMTSATKLEAHNVLQCCQIRIETQPPAKKIWRDLDIAFLRYACKQRLHTNM